MKHFGDITKLNGAELPIVDVICGGSPCQDLSVAGKRAGLDGERSGLFMEQIRIIKEMRNECVRQLQLRGSNEPIRPRYMVWENVPGAFSSNKGEDFRIVLEETARIADETASIPEPEGGRWSTSGCIMGAGWSIAWRVHDAQFWGVPQRRRRIALVADFGGATAPEILFERKSLSGDPEESGTKRKRIAGDTERGADKTGTIGFHLTQDPVASNDLSYAVSCGSPHGQCVNGVCSINGEVAGTLDANYYKGCGERQGTEREVVYCLQGNGIDRADTADCNGKGWREDKSYTLNTIDRPAVCAMQAIGEYRLGGGVTSSLKQRDHKDATDLVIQSGRSVPEMQNT